MRSDGRTDRPTDRPTDRLLDKQADEQTDVMKLIEASRNSANAPTNGLTAPRVTVQRQTDTDQKQLFDIRLYTIDFKYSLILGDILTGVYVKINSTTVPCRVPADRLAMHLHKGERRTAALNTSSESRFRTRLKYLHGI